MFELYFLICFYVNGLPELYNISFIHLNSIIINNLFQISELYPFSKIYKQTFFNKLIYIFIKTFLFLSKTKLLSAFIKG